MKDMLESAAPHPPPPGDGADTAAIREIADRLGNWSLRERAFSLEHDRRTRLERSTGFDPEWVLDEEDVRTIAGTMGRFPSFRDTCWRILSQARILEPA